MRYVLLLFVFYCRGEAQFAGGKFREIPFAVGIFFAGGNFCAKSKLANIAKMSYTRKVRVVRYGNATVMADCDNGSMHTHSRGSSNIIS